jgi:hypothetical protein
VIPVWFEDPSIPKFITGQAKTSDIIGFGETLKEIDVID